MRFRLTATAVAACAVAGLIAATALASGGPQVRTYEVTITNLTGGQALTPALIATHRPSLRVFKVGRPASFGVQEIAENGNLAPLAAELDADRRVWEIVQGSEPLVPAANPGGTPFGSSVTLTITAGPGARVLSYVAMLICTNDGMTGVSGLPLPHQVGQSVSVPLAGYDAGTELNTEDFADIVPPCQSLIGVSSGEPGTGTTNPALAEGGVIRHHPGILGVADLVAGIHGWADPVATIEVTRIG
jgi:hypothetical protein